MAGANPLFYWDSCLFLAWLGDEQRKPGEMDGVREIISRQKRREVRICTSALTIVEVLESKIPVGVGNAFAELLKRVNRISMDIKVAKIAHDIRDHYAQKGGTKLMTPDAIHLATAILNRADEFHTFDDLLLSLSGNVGGHRLKVCKPEARNPQLDLGPPSPPNSGPKTRS
ncbi:MAG: PIN domain-containing protein [Bauldia sp.]|nr:PIN domain-containing protein [Bauldia sp.]